MNWWDFPLNLVVGQNPQIVFIVVLVIAWALTPGLVLLIGRVLEDRRVPLDSRRQFYGFFPGDLFLGISVASAFALATQLPVQGGWYTSWWMRLIILVIACFMAWLLTYLELRGNLYSKRQIMSPTKLYHNILLYAGYGSVAGSVFWAVLFGALSWWILIVVVPIGLWIFCNVLDNKPTFPGDKPIRRKARTAHVADWKPIWRH